MKKVSMITLLLTLSLIFTSSVGLAQDNFQKGKMNVSIGMDLMGSHEISMSDSTTNLDIGGTEDTELGLSAVAEYTIPYNKNMNLGGGAEFQLPRKQKDYEGNFNFIPFYGLAEYKLKDNPIYLKGKVGYNFFNGDDTYTGTAGNLNGGLFYGFGGGFEIQDNITAEFIYSVNKGSVEYTGYDLEGNISYSKLRAAIGFKF